MAKYTTKALDPTTWPDFARLVEVNNGVWGGCWCMWYHGKEEASAKSATARRKAKECLVRRPGMCRLVPVRLAKRASAYPQ